MIDRSRVAVLISMLMTAEGGRAGPAPSGTPFLLVIFGDEVRPTDPSVTIGARIRTADGSGLQPGSNDVPATLEFVMAPAEGLALASAHRSILLWEGRVVGRGRVLGVPDAQGPPRLVHGTSAYRAARQQLKVGLVAAALLPVWIVVVFDTTLPSRPTLFPLLALALISLGVVLFVLSLRANRAVDRERRAGLHDVVLDAIRRPVATRPGHR